MRTFIKWAVVLLVPAVWVATAWPADPEFPSGATVKLLLLRQKSVQKELELSADVVQKIAAFTNAESEEAGKALKLGEAARKEEFEKLARKNEKFLTDNLTAKQAKRLDQIFMQFSALTQLTRPEVVKELKLSDEQVKKLKDMQTEGRKALAELFESKERARAKSSRSSARRPARKSWPS
jgi:hypothetical protein